ncbi:MAG: hypothetical protein ACRDZQ_13540, partial [Acidimicrobiales bacterium]
LSSDQVWVHKLGNPPGDPAARDAWLRAAATVAAYRERWGIGQDHRPLGPEGGVSTVEQVGHRKRAQVAVQRALGLPRGRREDHRTTEPALTVEPGRELEEGVEL